MKNIFSLKNVVVLFMIFASLFSFGIIYNHTKTQAFNKMENAGNKISRSFWIPDSLLLSDPNEMYQLLLKAANQSRVNIFRTNITYTTNNQPEIVKYVLLTGKTRFFDSFKLRSGSFLTAQDTKQGNSFLSTVNTHSPNQLGILQDFGGGNLIEIKPLKTAYKNLPVYGQYFVEGSNNQAYNTFVDSLSSEINQYYHNYLTNPVTPKIFTKAPNNSGGGAVYGAGTSLFKYTRDMIFVITLLLLVYYSFYESKRIGIMKMHGASNTRLWSIVVGRLIALSFVLSAVLSLIAAMLVKDTTAQFVGSVLFSQVKTYVIVTIISLVSYLYIFRIKVSNVIKNRKDTKAIFLVNTVLKAAFSIFIIVMGISVLNQYTVLHVKQESLKNWGKETNYGVFYPVQAGKYLSDLQSGSPKMTEAETMLYPVLNKMGSIFIDASEYEENVLRLNLAVPNHILSITVNPNYLREFPVYDVNHKAVHISENNPTWILLVPQKYRNRQKQIMDYFSAQRKSSYQTEKQWPGLPPAARFKNQQIKIIWTANNQKIFSFDPNVFPTENNVIIDPIIQVVTEQNSLPIDLADMITGSGASEALKVNLIQGNTTLTLQKLQPELKKVGLTGNLKYLITINQFVLQQIYTIQKQIDVVILTAVGLIIGLLLLVAQNLSIFFHNHQRRFIVRRLFGIGFFRTYKEYIWLFSGTWVLQVGIGFLLKNSSIFSAPGNGPVQIPSKYFLWVALGLIVFELVVSIIVLVFIERRNKVKVLKEAN